eukprot:scaffold21681_cov27-Tisochrysis_lutea.AAC.4
MPGDGAAIGATLDECERLDGRKYDRLARMVAHRLNFASERGRERTRWRCSVKHMRRQPSAMEQPQLAHGQHLYFCRWLVYRWRHMFHSSRPLAQSREQESAYFLRHPLASLPFEKRDAALLRVPVLWHLGRELRVELEQA